MKYIFIVFMVLLVPTGSVYADEASFSDNRIRTLRYNPDDVYLIHTLYGYQTSIEFGPREQVETISVGDRSLWQIIPSGSRLFIRPVADDMSTNMTVLTNKHSYQFDLKSGKGKLADNRQVVYVARFTYPDEAPPDVAGRVYEPAVVAAPVQPYGGDTATRRSSLPMPGTPAPSALKMNYLYTYSGPDDMAPAQVYDDGRSTFIRFKDMKSQLPRLYVLEANGRQVQVPMTLRNGFMVIDTVAERIALVDQQDRTVLIYNEMLSSGS